VDALASWPGLAGIRELYVSQHDSDVEVTSLFQPPHLTPRLQRLDLSGSVTTEEGASLLAECQALRGLQWLGFAYNGLTEAKVRALIDSPSLGNIEALHLGSEHDLDAPGVGTQAASALGLLARSAGFPRLRDVVIGSETAAEAQQALRLRFGPRLRIFADC
jgi:hypothetical protein